MALLTAQERSEVVDQLMKEISAAGEECNQVESILFTLIDDLDVWVDSNASNVNQAISLPARNLGTPVKARAFTLVVRKRYIKGV